MSHDVKELDLIRQRVFDGLKNVGLSQNEASRRIGQTPSYLNQYLWRGSPRVLPEDVRERLAALLGVDQQYLKASGNDPSATQPLMVQSPSIRAQRPFAGPRDLPLYAARMAGESDDVVTTTDVVEFIERPDTLVGVQDAYAVRILSTVFEPRYSQGDTLYFHPWQPVFVKDGCSVLLADGGRLFGVVDSITEDRIVLTSLEPRRKTSIDRRDCVKICREIGVLRR